MTFRLRLVHVFRTIAPQPDRCATPDRSQTVSACRLQTAGLTYPTAVGDAAGVITVRAGVSGSAHSTTLDSVSPRSTRTDRVRSRTIAPVGTAAVDRLRRARRRAGRADRQRTCSALAGGRAIVFEADGAGRRHRQDGRVQRLPLRPRRPSLLHEAEAGRAPVGGPRSATTSSRGRGCRASTTTASTSRTRSRRRTSSAGSASGESSALHALVPLGTAQPRTRTPRRSRSG